MRKKDIMVEELKQLLIAYFNYNQLRRVEMQKRLQQSLGEEIKKENSKVLAIEENLKGWMADIIAKRLKRNRRNVTLLSSRDFNKIIPDLLENFEKVEGEELDNKERKMFTKFMKLVFGNIFEILYSIIPENENPYDEYWRWVRTVVDLANERGISLMEIISNKENADEVTRRMFTLDQFVVLSKRTINKFVDSDAIKKTIIQPILVLDIISELDEEERKEIEKELEEEVMPQLREIMGKAKVFLNTILEEEVMRIYSAS